VDTDPDKIATLKNWPIPQTVQDVRSYLCFVGYYRRYIKGFALVAIEGFASVARPLHDLLKEPPGQKKHSVKRPTKKEWVNHFK
jgi:hypothetical protein